ncbi:MAG: hypothetical protein R3A46_15115 [Thermomicrobiales bacterium]
MTAVHEWADDQPLALEPLDLLYRRNLFPDRAIYELRALARLAAGTNLTGDNLDKELGRILKRKRVEGRELGETEIGIVLDLVSGSPEQLKLLANGLCRSRAVWLSLPELAGAPR